MRCPQVAGELEDHMQDAKLQEMLKELGIVTYVYVVGLAPIFLVLLVLELVW